MRNKIIEEDLQVITSYNLPWDKFEGKTVLITGMNGFLPAYMAETLLYLNEKKLRKKIKLIGLVRNRKLAEERFSFYSARKDLELICQDVVKPIKIDGNVDFIIHAASQASPKYYGKDPVGTLLPNVVGTVNMLELARIKKSQGLLFFSSGEVYGKIETETIKEGDYGYLDPADLRSCYAESKRTGETMCVSWHHQFNIPAKIVRPFHVYGPGMKLDDGRVFADFVSNMVKNENIIMKSDGTDKRTFCYLVDATIAFFTVLLLGKPGQAYNIGNCSQEVSIKELAEILVSLSPNKELKVVTKARDEHGYISSYVNRSCPDTSKLEALGWRPSYSIKKGFERTIRSYYEIN